MSFAGSSRGSGPSVDSDPAEATSTASSTASPSPPTATARTPRRGRIASIAFLVFGLAVASYLAKRGPQEQHVRVVLGAGAPEVTGVDLRYLAASESESESRDPEVAREAHFSWPAGQAPRVVAHEPKLPHGDYRLQIDIDAHDGRRSVQRQVTLGGGSTQIDVSSTLTR
jgi:hypothetical protein